jgi:hypothetical protein
MQFAYLIPHSMSALSISCVVIEDNRPKLLGILYSYNRIYPVRGGHQAVSAPQQTDFALFLCRKGTNEAHF